MTYSATSRPSVLIVSYGLIAGGGETFPIFLANALRARGWPVAFLDFGKEAAQLGVRNMLQPNVPLYHLRDDLNIGRLCQELAIDVVHSCHTTCDLLIAKNLQRLPSYRRPKHLVTLHGGYETMTLPDLLASLPILEHVDQFTYSASKNLDSFPKRFLEEKRFTRIDNALPHSSAARTPRSRTDLGVSEEAIIAILISRAIPGKGWDLARIAVESVRRKSGRDIQLIIIGDGPIYDEMTKALVPDWLHLLGFQADIRSWISIADVALLPSTFSGESFPLVLIDYLAMGVPTIASSVGEIPRMLRSSLGVAGYVIETTDGGISGTRLASRIEKFTSLDKGDRDLLRARALKAAEKFDFDHMMHAFERVYETLAP
jgi:glycosyltransferase involved in cell wall biosynthesis